MIFSDKNRPKTVIFGNIKLQFTKIAENQLYKQWQLFIYQKRIIRYTVKRACALIRILTAQLNNGERARGHGVVPQTTAWSRMSVHDYHIR